MMRKIAGLAASLALVAGGAAAGVTDSFSLTSTTFKNNGYLPKSTVYDKAGCNGENRSPDLAWSGAPKATKSFAVIMHDPDAPAPGGWYHWVVYNVPSTTHSFATAEQIPPNELGKTSWGEIGYGGPCPPPGKPHHYHFTLYALDTAHLGGDALTGPQVESAVRGHVLAQTTLTGLYKQ
ncbi:MAG: YbhB/YbcL family Raf kinase inhibitor-like protein [Vulcanimicrobiaceae bacterium]